MITWLASYPRSGNTLLRMMLHAGWGLGTTSQYAPDVAENPALARLCGHYELPVVDDRRLLPEEGLVKTHERPDNPRHAFVRRGRSIYGVRDGRAVAVSYWHYRRRPGPLPGFLRRTDRFGPWGEHERAWRRHAPSAPVIRYEDMVRRDDAVVKALATMFGPPTSDVWAPLDRRDEVARLDGHTVRARTDWRDDWSDEADALFWERHGETMTRLYPDARPGDFRDR